MNDEKLKKKKKSLKTTQFRIVTLHPAKEPSIRID